MLVGGDQETAGTAGGIADGAADLGIDHLGQHTDLARGTELAASSAASSLARYSKRSPDIGIHAEKGDGRDDVHRARRVAVGDDDGGVAEYGAPPGRVRGGGPAAAWCRAVRSMTSLSGLEVRRSSAGVEIKLLVTILEFAEEGR